MLAADTMSLPAPLDQYFAADDHRQTIAMFAADAAVRDEGGSYAGHAEIATWLDRVETSYHPRYRVLSGVTEGPYTVVTFEVSGSFPGSPATLRQCFGLRDGLIESLETL